VSDWIGVEEAWERIEARLSPLGRERVPLDAAVGRVLAEEVRVDRDAPAFDRAAMDGFAVRAEAVQGASSAHPVRLAVVGESTPGRPYPGPPRPGSVRIMTGAALPDGWDAVVPVEDTSGFAGAEVEIRAAVAPDQNVTRRASERRAGEALFGPGRRLGPVDVGALALVGAAHPQVGRRARVAVLATGNELLPHATSPGPFSIRDSNSPLLAALAGPFAAGVDWLGTARDERDELENALRRGLAADLLLVSGGVSMGAYDLVGECLVALGVRFEFRRVALQPGKPTGFATHAGGAVLALPGNPVSALTTFRLFGTCALRRLEGEARTRPDWERLPARFAWQRRHAKLLVLPGRRTPGGVDRVPYAGSGDLLAYARADCQIVLGPDVERVEPGDAVSVWPLGPAPIPDMPPA
jgi:molybdopterin molybdotransferase